MGKCRIKVIKKLANVELLNEYRAIQSPEEDSTCEFLKVGQEFVYENGGPVPEGFCAWAWADINRDVESICAGADFYWMKQKGTLISCCTDGLRPVIFKIEKID